MKLSKNFESEEFDCQCGCDLTGINMDADFIDKLQKIRAQIDFPLIVTSGLRCKSHNARVGGSSRSKHMLGIAVDFYLTDAVKRYELVYLAMDYGLSVGVGKTFIHLDMRKGVPVLFGY